MNVRIRMNWFLCGLVAVFLVTHTTDLVHGQDAGTTGTSPNDSKRGLAVNLVRAITTGEMNYRGVHGTYASWDVLAASDEFTKARDWAVRNDHQLANLNLSKSADILPGWNLRLTLSKDEKNFDVLLEDTTDKACGYAVFTDERGIIRQSKAIDCPI